MAIFPSLKVKAPKQSNHDLSHKRRTTMAPGVLYPLATIPVVSGDKVKISIESLIKTYPLLAPLMGSYKLQCDIYYSPLSLYNQRLHHNASLTFNTGTSGQVPDAEFPYFTFRQETAGTSDYYVGPNSLLRYLGFPVGYTDSSTQDPITKRGTKRYNAIPLLMYYDIVRNYYANRQETLLPVMSGFSSSSPLFKQVSLNHLDAIYSGPMSGDMSLTPMSNSETLESVALGISAAAMGGLALRCYLPDVKNVILNNTLAAAVGNATSVSTAGNSFTIDQFNLARKLYKVYTLTQLAGNRFSEWLRAQYAVKPDIRVDMPTFIGSTSTDVVFEDVVSTVEGPSGNMPGDPLGTLAGRGRGYADGKMHTFVADQPGYIQIIVSLVPRVDYYQFVHRYLLDTQLSDLFVNELNGLGLQDVLAADINGSRWEASSINPYTTSFGKQPAWIHLMTAVNEVFGDFTEDKLRGWTLSRNMGTYGTAPSAYVQPNLYNYAFADTSDTAQNFLAQFALTIYKRSNVSKRLMPTV